jgi:hypothetical protein
MLDLLGHVVLAFECLVKGEHGHCRAHCVVYVRSDLALDVRELIVRVLDALPDGLVLDSDGHSYLHVVLRLGHRLARELLYPDRHLPGNRLQHNLSIAFDGSKRFGLTSHGHIMKCSPGSATRENLPNFSINPMLPL